MIYSESYYAPWRLYFKYLLRKLAFRIDDCCGVIYWVMIALKWFGSNHNKNNKLYIIININKIITRFKPISNY